MPGSRLHPLFLSFSDATLEQRFQQDFNSKAILRDLLWCAVTVIMYINLWWRLGAHAFKHPIMSSAILLYNAAWVAPGLVLTLSTTDTYLRYRRCFMQAPRIARCLALAAVYCAQFPGPMIDLSMTNVLAAPLVIPFTYHLIFKDFLMLHAPLAVLSWIAYASPHGYCTIIEDGAPASDHLSRFFHRIGVHMWFVPSVTQLFPMELGFSPKQHCQVVSTMSTLVLGFVVPTMMLYVFEYRSRKAFAARGLCEVQPYALVEQVEQCLGGVVFIASLACLQVIMVSLGQLRT